jgi:ATP-dependent Clp protease adaptor protein ClpS
MIKGKDNPAEKRKEKQGFSNCLILFNDDIHSFDFVIETLIEVCGHEQMQAEQCALIAHYRGKCPVKSGDLSELTPKHVEMTKRGLTVSIEPA